MKRSVSDRFRGAVVAGVLAAGLLVAAGTLGDDEDGPAASGASGPSGAAGAVGAAGAAAASEVAHGAQRPQ